MEVTSSWREDKLEFRPRRELTGGALNPAIPYTYPGIADDVQRLRGLLTLALRTVAWCPPPAPAILNLACGRADESGVLLSSIAPHAAELFYLGIDLRPVEIAEAKSRWIPAAPPGWQLDFRAGDASRTDRMKQLPPFDLVFIRHQNYWHDPASWLVLFRNALAALKHGGVLVITSYFDREHELAMACLVECGAIKLADIQHPHARPLPDAPNKAVDRRMGVFQVRAEPANLPKSLAS